MEQKIAGTRSKNNSRNQITKNFKTYKKLTLLRYLTSSFELKVLVFYSAIHVTINAMQISTAVSTLGCKKNPQPSPLSFLVTMKCHGRNVTVLSVNLMILNFEVYL